VGGAGATVTAEAGAAGTAPNAAPHPNTALSTPARSRRRPCDTSSPGSPPRPADSKDLDRQWWDFRAIP